MTIDFTTDIGKIRAVINDTNEEELEFPDEQIQAYLDMSSGNLGQAAILALQGLVSKYTATAGDSYRVDTIAYEEGKSKASTYLSLLNNLKQSLQDGTSPLVTGTPRVYGVYREDRKENLQRMRDGEIIPPKTLDDEYDLIDLKHQFGPYYQG